MKLTKQRIAAFAEYVSHNEIQVYGNSTSLWLISMNLSERFECSDFELVSAHTDQPSTLTMWVRGHQIWDAVLEAMNAGVQFDYEGGILYAS